MPESSPPTRLQVFLCHSSSDKKAIRALYQRLSAEAWIQPWLDEEDLIVGQRWRDEIEKAVERSHVILVCLSPESINKEGFVQREIRVALEHADYMPEGTIYIIPLKLQPCEVPRRLKEWQWVDYFEERGYVILLRGLRLRAEKLGISFVTPQPSAPPQPQNPPPPVQPKAAQTPPPAARPTPQPAPPTEQDRLLNEINNFATPHQRRREIGDLLSKSGDPRPGVGIITASIGGRRVELPQLEWCEIPAPPGGKVWLGADNQSDNKRREVAQGYGFKMAKYPITYRQYQSFSDSGQYADPRWWQDFPKEYQPQALAEQNHKGDSYPRDKVSWYQGVAFTRWLTACYRATGELSENEEIRLPGEIEWEYAARGTDEREYPWGKWQEGYANTNEAGLGQTVAVGLYPQGASPFGVQDMSGQVWEWCLNDYSTGKISTPKAKKSSLFGAIQQNISSISTDYKVLRGGSFYSNAGYAACAYRNCNLPHLVFFSFGLRVVVAAPVLGL